MKDKSLEYLNLSEAAELFNFKKSRLRTAVFRREVPHIKIGGLIRFRRSDLVTWLENKVVNCER